MWNRLKYMIIGLMMAAVSVVFYTLAGCEIENEDGETEQVVISAECNWYGGVECDLQCDSFEFWVSCEGEMDVECDPNCDELEFSVECSASCEADCGLECTGDWSVTDCELYCQGDCEASCEGECSASADEAECAGHCDGYCEGHCHAGCEIEAPDCDGWCEASCEGECSAEANIDCHGGCDSDGVLECNGEFIDRKDLEAAVDWVRAHMDAEITFEGDAECYGNTCSAEGSCAFECAVGSTGRGANALGTGLFVLLLGAILVIRRRRG
jgi:MYXO-CTERM domain-containing protein